MVITWSWKERKNMAISRQELVENLCSIANDTDKRVATSAKEVLRNLLTGKISESVASEYYNSLVNDNSPYWSTHTKPKVIYDNLKKYKKGALNDIQLAKLISSIVTHSLIEVEINGANLDELGVQEFLSVVNNYVSNNIGFDINEESKKLLLKYGFLTESEVD